MSTRAIGSTCFMIGTFSTGRTGVGLERRGTRSIAVGTTVRFTHLCGIRQRESAHLFAPQNSPTEVNCPTMRLPGIPSLFFLFYLLILLPWLAIRSAQILRARRQKADSAPAIGRRDLLWIQTTIMMVLL